MTAKEYLSQARYLDLRINNKIRQVAMLHELATKCTSTISDMPRNPSPRQSGMADTINKIIDLESEINRNIDHLVDLKREMTAVIRSVEDSQCQMVLEMRYICLRTWEQIAQDLNCGINNVFKLHKKALKLVAVPEIE